MNTTRQIGESINAAIFRWAATVDLHPKPHAARAEEQIHFVILPHGVGTKSLWRLMVPFSGNERKRIPRSVDEKAVALERHVATTSGLS